MNHSAHAPSPGSASHEEPALILAVDDRPANLIALERCLAGTPCRIIKALSGEEALAASLRYSFALAILDVQMPGMDGYELAEFLLADPSTSRTPIIFVTAAYSDEQHRFKGYSAGAVDYLVKPYDPAILTSKVRVFLELARHRQGLEGMVADRTRALRASEERYRTLYETMSQGVLYQDATGRITEANPAAQRILGVTREALLDQAVGQRFDVVRADGRALSDDELPSREALRSGRVVSDVELGLRAAGTPRRVWVRVTATPQCRPGESTPYQVHTIFSDVTARREAEQRLEDSERALRAVFDAMHDGVIAVDCETRAVQMANEAMFRLLGREAESGRGAEAYQTLPEDMIEGMFGPRGSGRDDATRVVQMPLQRDDGREALAEVSLATITLRGRPTVLGIYRDVTERTRQERDRERLQAELFQAQRMESVGLLAGGIAHDFNNLLSVILGFVGLVLDSPDTSAETRQDLLEARQAAERSAELTRQLLAFSRKQVMRAVSLDLNQVAHGIDKLLRRIIGEDIDLTLLLAPDLGVVFADPGQIEQVIVNLAVNARDAMPTGGRLMIRTSNADLDEAQAREVQVPPGAYVRLSVADTGCGIEPSTMSRIFEPFFTTKPKDKGTGLGLSTVYGIVKQSHGHVVVTSEVGVGSAFDVYLPRKLGAADGATVRPVMNAEIRGGTETVLVVEDADQVRSVVIRALQAAGYEVLSAVDGVDALKILAARAAPVDLVLSDVIMPNMGGPELAERLATQPTPPRLLFMSGYAGTSADSAVSGVSREHFVEKPFRVDVLLRAVRRALDGEPPVSRSPAPPDDPAQAHDPARMEYFFGPP